MRMQCAIVEFLSKHPKVERLIYPFHESHPQYKVAKQQMKNGGGMISFIMKGGKEAAIKMVESHKDIHTCRITRRRRIADRSPRRDDTSLRGWLTIGCGPVARPLIGWELRIKKI